MNDSQTSSIDSIQQIMENIEPLNRRLKENWDIIEKVGILSQFPAVIDFLKKSKTLNSFLKNESADFHLIIKSLLAIGQGPILFRDIDNLPNSEKALNDLVERLIPIQNFYEPIGGIIGYHVMVLKLMLEKERGENSNSTSKRYLEPPEINLIEDSELARKAIKAGILNLPKMAEFYPVGGAGDRLNLKDEKTGEPLPAAELKFCGRTQLEGLLRDLQGREYLYYKLTGKQTTTQVAMMTSEEKKNSHHIRRRCEESKWFNRPLDSFLFFFQHSVPVITIKGDWAATAPCQLSFKPGGHGVMWKLASDQGIFNALNAKGISKAIVRQINNPVSGLDDGLLAFAGIGFETGKAFGFSSCSRILNTAEGMNILIETKIKNGYTYNISNIEYTDFIQKGVPDLPAKPGSIYSAYPANTNILFADLKVVEKTILKCPIPGMLINMKNRVKCLNREGNLEETFAGRLESLMQNLADAILDFSKIRMEVPASENLSTFLTYSPRQKTISVTKKAYTKGQPILETPEGCFYDLLKNYRTLLVEHCNFIVPPLNSEQDYIANGPSFLLHYHPSLGPLFSVIQQKIKGGELKFGSELSLEIAEVEIRNLLLDGSMKIVADSVSGHLNEKQHLVYSEQNGKCTLKNVTVLNKGINRQESNQFWKGCIFYDELLSIVLHGDGEFYAENVTFKGNLKIEVPSGHLMQAYEKDGEILYQLSALSSPSWKWEYSFDESDHIRLKKVFTP